MQLPLNQLLLGECLKLLEQLPDCCVDSCVTDPPYGLGNKDPDAMDLFMYVLGATLDTGGDFMGQDWEIPSVQVWREVYRVLKPGGYVVAFGGTRTFDLISIGLRMAGFECRDTIAREFPGVELPILQWIQSQGMPKSHAVGKAIDKKLGKKRKVVGSRPIAYPDSPSGYTSFSANSSAREGGIWNETTGEAARGRPVTAPESDEASQWEGWGSALKPSWEPILLFRKPFKGTLAENVLEHGTGGINIDATRVKHASKADFESHKAQVDAIKQKGGSRGKSWKNSSDLSGANEVKEGGRWPANCLLEHSPLCRQLGTKEIAPHPQGPDRFQKTSGGGFSDAYGNQRAGDEPEFMPIWQCVEGCPVRELNEQSGDRPSTLTGRADPNTSHKHPGHEMNPNSTFLGERTHLSRVYADGGGAARFFTQFEGEDTQRGRWPANVVFEHLAGCANLGPRRFRGSGTSKTFHEGYEGESPTGFIRGVSHAGNQHGDADGLETADTWQCEEGCPIKALDEQNSLLKQMEGGGDASRFFSQFDGVPFKYVPKANRKEAGCGEFEVQHITVKPLSLMRWLVKLVTQKGGVVLDMYAGSGTTLHAAILEEMQFVGMERDETNHAEAQRRLEIVLRKEEERRYDEELFEFAHGGEQGSL